MITLLALLASMTTIGGPDGAGVKEVQVTTDPIVFGASGTIEGSETFSVPAGCVLGARSFVGVDYQDQMESTLEVGGAGSFWIFERAEHKEAGGNYDAWREHRLAVPYRMVPGSNSLVLHYLVRATGGQGGRVQFALRILVGGCS